MDHWIESVSKWNDLLKRFQLCHLPALPRGQPDVKDKKSVRKAMERFLRSHMVHVRNFVKSHPSHALIELNLYDAEVSSSVMDSLFPSDGSKSTCWGHRNKNNKGTNHQDGTKSNKPNEGTAKTAGLSQNNSQKPNCSQS